MKRFNKNKKHILKNARFLRTRQKRYVSARMAVGIKQIQCTTAKMAVGIKKGDIIIENNPVLNTYKYFQVIDYKL